MFDCLKDCYDPEEGTWHWNHKWTHWEEVAATLHTFLGGWRQVETTAQVRYCNRCNRKEISRI